VLVELNAQLTQTSRVAIVGENGSGKTTLLRLLCGDIEACKGSISRRSGLRVALMPQHHLDALKPFASMSAGA
jgi:ATPase subunit of ABC transporter with duplicated ATPase domains